MLLLMPRPGGGHIGHSKHRKAFGAKKHKSALNRILLQKDENAKIDEAMRVRESQKPPMVSSIKQLLEGR